MAGRSGQVRCLLRILPLSITFIVFSWDHFPDSLPGVEPIADLKGEDKPRSFASQNITYLRSKGNQIDFREQGVGADMGAPLRENGVRGLKNRNVRGGRGG